MRDSSFLGTKYREVSDIYPLTQRQGEEEDEIERWYSLSKIDSVFTRRRTREREKEREREREDEKTEICIARERGERLRGIGGNSF